MTLRRFSRLWHSLDPPVKLSLALAIALLGGLLALGFGGPDEIQFPARVGAFGTLITLQLLFLWGNRRDISPYHQAQARFIAGDYQAAREILEQIPEGGRISVDALTLLGNSYRHLGQYEPCRRALDRALALKPDHHLALFSRGKLSLVLGEFQSASERFERALCFGAPALARFESGRAQLWLGERERALTQFTAAEEGVIDDPAHHLMLRYCLFLLDAADPPEIAPDDPSLRHWRDEAAKHSDTPYGQRLRAEIEDMTRQPGER